VSWESYVQILRAFDNRHLRITYDRGGLEIMTLSSEHERLKHLLRRLIEALTEELEWEIAGYGSMTFKRRREKRGLEPDECFWIQSEPLVRGKDEIDMKSDPPPDLVVEIEWTRSVLNRMGIFAKFRVPEVWSYDGQTLQVRLLGADGKYLESSTSRAFPFLPVAELLRFLALRSSMSETELVRQFRAWVRERIAANWQ
jgi:Uma2 family endonuclease